jgi:membrane protease YdiL (CAAX protease family)
VAVCVTAFVLGHAGQGLPRAVFLSVFAIACHVLVRATSSLYPAIAFHFLYDFCAGVAHIRFARKATPETA